MVEAFKKTDKFQRLRGTGSEEEVSEQVLLLQDLVDRREAREDEKKAKKEKEQQRRDSLESTGSQLCLEAEQRVAKRQRTSSSVTKKEEADAGLLELLDFEKQRHSDDHAYRMERLEFDKEEQRIRLAQMSESAKRNEQLERLLIEMGKLIQVVEAIIIDIESDIADDSNINADPRSEAGGGDSLTVNGNGNVDVASVG
ncbi:hypothetical protein DYB32_010750, partial [Aphanomyces invadans]